MVKHIAKIVLGDEMYYVKDTEARDALIDLSEKGVAGGVATLDNSGKVPSSQLPESHASVSKLTVGETEYNPVDGNITIPAYPTYSAGSGLSLSGTTFSLALTKALVTTALGYTPPTTDTNTWRTVQCNGTSIGDNTLNLKAGTNVSLSNSNGTITISSTDTNTWRGITNTYTGSDLSTSVSQYGTNALYNALVNGYASSAGNADTVDGYHASSFCMSNDSRLSNSRPASDVYSWAKASSKPSYSWSEISDRPSIPSGYLLNLYISCNDNSKVGNTIAYYCDSTGVYINSANSINGLAFQWYFENDGHIYGRKRRDWANWNSWQDLLVIS